MSGSDGKCCIPITLRNVSTCFWVEQHDRDPPPVVIMALGAGHAAGELLRGRDEPESGVLRSEAALTTGLPELARELCEWLLSPICRRRREDCEPSQKELPLNWE
jgi:hypothetical protein